MAIIKTTEELKQYLPVSAVFEMKDINPFIPRAEKFVIKKALGQELFDALHTAYNDVDPLSDEHAALLPLVQEVVANMAYLRHIPHAQILSSKDGMHITQSDQKKAAYKWQVYDLKKDVCDAAYSALEELLEFLEENKEDYALWVDSKAYTEFYECLITRAGLFNIYHNINNSRLMFLSCRYLILRAQQALLIPVMGQELFDDIITKLKEGDLVTDKYDKLYPYIGPAICNQVVADALIELPVTITDYGTILNYYKEYALDAEERANDRADRITKRNQCLEIAIKSVQDLQNYLYANVDDYPLYESSDAYTALNTQREGSGGSIPGSTYVDEDHTTDPTIDSHFINLRGGSAIM